MAAISFHTDGLPVRIEVPAGATILEAARKAGVVIESPCNGSGTCGKCGVKVNNLANVRQTVGHRLPSGEEGSGWVLSCHTEALGDIDVIIPAERREKLKILGHGAAAKVGLNPFMNKIFITTENKTAVFAGDDIIAFEEGNTSGELYGLVVDIGTTTLVVSLVDLITGEESGHASALNPQALHAQDVLSRIKIGSKPEGLSKLHTELIEGINGLISRLTAELQVRRENIYEAVFSGNTTMLHLALGADPASLGKFPYTPALNGGSYSPAKKTGLQISGHGKIYLPPVLSAYVGADITSGVLATSLHREKGVILFVDIGTNGEMVLAVDGKLTATSTAAGPAFEGMNIACGMRAAAGAVEEFAARDGEVFVKTVEEAEPTGICGSGLVDLVGELARNGVIDKNGRFAKLNGESSPGLRERLSLREGKPVFSVAGPVYLTQKDVRQVQLAKGAVRAGIELLLKAEGVFAGEVDRVLIAGSFGYHLRAKSLANLGLIPREFENRVEFVGNTSKTGGHGFLINAGSREEFLEVAKRVKILELANDPGFEKTFVGALAFPDFSGAEDAL